MWSMKHVGLETQPKAGKPFWELQLPKAFVVARLTGQEEGVVSSTWEGDSRELREQRSAVEGRPVPSGWQVSAQSVDYASGSPLSGPATPAPSGGGKGGGGVPLKPPLISQPLDFPGSWLTPEKAAPTFSSLMIWSSIQYKPGPWVTRPGPWRIKGGDCRS